MDRIYSKQNPKNLLNVVCRKADLVAQRRLDFASEEEVLQAAIINLQARDSIPPHRHLKNKRTTETTQEMMIVIEGKLEAKLFDTDNTFLQTVILEGGDCLVCYRGGHGYKALEPNTQIYELKNGPYNGKNKDKEKL